MGGRIGPNAPNGTASALAIAVAAPYDTNGTVDCTWPFAVTLRVDSTMAEVLASWARLSLATHELCQWHRYIGRVYEHSSPRL